MSKRYSFAAVEERPVPQEADALGSLLAAHHEWTGLFIVLLQGLNLKSVPSMTAGSEAFLAATKRHDDAHRILSALDDLYREVRDGYEITHAHGQVLERFVWHLLGERFADRLAACELHEDGAPCSDYRLDAATCPEAPSVGVEAKTSERALAGYTASQRLQRAAKAAWVIALPSSTDSQIAGVFATWTVEERFRGKLGELLNNPPAAAQAPVIAHSQLSQLPNRVAAIRQRLTAAPAPSAGK